jgi:argininosuccinate lyase
MPQKRNAFVLENIRGQAVQPTAALVHTLTALKSTPFSNGIEVSAESTAFTWQSLRAARKAMRLMALLLEGMQVYPDRMRSFLASAQTTMTALADLLVARYGLAFRTAHDAVGSLLRNLPEGAAEDAEILSVRLEEILATVFSRPVHIDREAVSATLDPMRSMESALYGGGPAPDSVRRQLESLAGGCARLRATTAGWRQGLRDAESKLAEEVAAASRPTI